MVPSPARATPSPVLINLRPDILGFLANIFPNVLAVNAPNNIPINTPFFPLLNFELFH